MEERAIRQTGNSSMVFDRRSLLVGTSRLALMALVDRSLCGLFPRPPSMVQHAWLDSTYWTDGTGWMVT